MAKDSDKRAAWWVDSRFGLFIHWGLYSVPARHEWIQTYEEMTPEKYAKYQEYFSPDKFDPTSWAKLAAAAGMKYFVFTAKHHDGFCLWDSQYTQYKAKKDYLREIVDAFRAEGLRAGIYYSLIDWNHPDFIIDVNHPLRNSPDREKLNANRNQQNYALYMRNQVRELLSNYGKIDVIWLDYSYPREDGQGKGRNDWESEKLHALVRELQPDILINDRMDLPEAGDFRSPEQYVPVNGIRDDENNLILWEGCQTFSGSWGYNRDELTWKSERQLISMLIKHVSRAGNFLLNIGPDARGRIDQRAAKLMQKIAAWMDEHAEAIYGCTIAPENMPEPEFCRYTYNPKTKRLYLHVFDWPARYLHLEKMAGKVKFARLLNDRSEIKMQEPVQHHGNMTAKTSKSTLTLLMPAVKPAAEIPVIELFLE